MHNLKHTRKNKMSPAFKAIELKRKHGEFAHTQAKQVYALIPYDNYDKKTYWDLVLKELDEPTPYHIQR